MEQNFTQWDLLTYTGLVACVVAIIGGLKKLFPTWIAGKEPHLGLSLSFILGVAAKLSIPGAYEKVHWVAFLVSLFFVAVAAKLAHDHLLNEVIKNKSPEKELEKKVVELVDAKVAEIKKS